MRMNFVAFFIILTICDVNAVIKFIKVGNCTTTNQSLHIERCEVSNSMLNVVLDIFKLVNQVSVSFDVFWMKLSINNLMILR